MNIDKYKSSVTVVMATYNGEKYLREQIDSILRQKNVEIYLLVRDDGSTDSTQVILEELKNKGLLEWYTGDHLGVQKGYLDLLKKAPDTDYYAFCDQDDVWDENKLSVAVSHLMKLNDQKPAIYYGSQKLVDENLNLLSVHTVETSRSARTNFLISNIAGCTSVFNSKLRDLLNMASPDFILMHDSWAFKVCLACGGNYYVDSEAYINYRQHGNNVEGLQGGLKGNMKQACRYITELKIKKQMQSLLICYGENMTQEYKDFSIRLYEYDKSLKSWMRLLFSKDFNFKKTSLNIVVRVKILLRKL